MKETCSSCKFYRPINCHRYPPSVVVYIESKIDASKYDRSQYDEVKTKHDLIESYSTSEFPEISPEEWCGEFVSQ